MNEVLNGELSVTLPEGFRAMSVDELRRYWTVETDAIRGFWDEERHVMTIITWNVSNRLLAKIASPKDVVKRVEKAQSRALKGSGYRKDGFFDSTVAGCRAHGVRFGYTVQGIAQQAEATVFIREANCYTLFYYYRAEDEQRLSPLHDEVIASLTWV